MPAAFSSSSSDTVKMRSSWSLWSTALSVRGQSSIETAPCVSAVPVLLGASLTTTRRHAWRVAFILGVLAAVVCIEKAAEARNGEWCAYYNAGDGGGTNCRFATLEQCLADVRGIGGNC